MTDSAILELRQIGFGQMWSLLQWWASISFGLIALTRFSAKQLNLTIVVSLSFLYILFTAFTSLNIAMLISTSIGYGQDLLTLRDAGNISAGGLRNYMFGAKWAPINGGIMILCLVSTFVGTISYLVYVYRKERQSANDDS